MSRLGGCLVEAEGAVSLELFFYRDAEGLRFCEGEIRATVRVWCQRCLGPLDVQLRSELKLQLVEGTAATKPRPGYEAWAAGRGAVSLLDLVEEELLLTLPMAPMHAEGQCIAGPWQQYLDVGIGARSPAPPLQRPVGCTFSEGDRAMPREAGK